MAIGKFFFEECDQGYSVSGLSDDGIRVWIYDVNQLGQPRPFAIVGSWERQRITTFEEQVGIPEGWYVVDVEYFEASGGAYLEMEWECGSNAY